MLETETREQIGHPSEQDHLHVWASPESEQWAKQRLDSSSDGLNMSRHNTLESVVDTEDPEVLRALVMAQKAADVLHSRTAVQASRKLLQHHNHHHHDYNHHHSLSHRVAYRQSSKRN